MSVPSRRSRWIGVGLNGVVAALLALNLVGWIVTLVTLGRSAPAGLPAVWSLPMVILSVPTVTFVVAGLAHAGTWPSRWRIQLVAIAALVVALPVSYWAVSSLLLAEQQPLPPTGRTNTTAPGIRSTWELQLTGPVAGRLSDPEFLGEVQQCGPSTGMVPPNYGIHSIIGRVGDQRVALTLWVTPYTGPGRYEIGRTSYVPARTAGPGIPEAAALPYRDVSLILHRIIGPLLNNEAEQWDSAAGSVTIGVDQLSGELDVQLQQHRIGGPTLRVTGRWSCSQPEYRPPH